MASPKKGDCYSANGRLALDLSRGKEPSAVLVHGVALNSLDFMPMGHLDGDLINRFVELVIIYSAYIRHMFCPLWLDIDPCSKIMVCAFCNINYKHIF